MAGPTSRTSRQDARRCSRALLALAVLLGGASACGSPAPERSVGPTIEVEPGPDAAGSSADGTAESAVAEVVGVVERRLGAGRATVAAASGGTIAVGTTIGVQLRRDGRATALPLDRVAAATALGVSPDGARLLVQWADATELWEVDGGSGPIERWPSSTQLTFDLEGRVVMTTGDEVGLMNRDGEVVGRTGPGPGRSFGPMAIDASTDLVVVGLEGGEGPEALIGRLPDGLERIEFDLGSGRTIDEVAISPGGRHVVVDLVGATGVFDRTLALWDLEAGTAGWSVPIDPDDVWAVDSAGTVLIAGPDGLRVVDPAGQERRVDEPGDEGRARSIHALGEGGFVTVTLGGQRVRRDATGTVVDPSIALDQPIASVAELSDGGLAIVDGIGGVEFIGPDGATSLVIDDFVAGFVNDLALLDDDSLAVATSSGSVRIESIDARNDGPVLELVHPEGNVDSVAFSDDGTVVVTGVGQRRGALSFDDSIVGWDRATGERLWETGGEAEEVAGCSTFANDVGFAADGGFVFGLSHDYSIEVIDRTTRLVVREIEAHAAPITGLAQAPDGSRIATSSEDSTLRLWDPSTGELVVDEVTPLGGFRSLAFLPGGAQLVGSDSFGQISLIDAASGRIDSTFPVGGSPNAELALSPDGRLVAVGDESVLRLWSVESGQVVGELAAHTGLVRSVLFSSDGTRLITGAGDGTVVVWNLETR